MYIYLLVAMLLETMQPMEQLSTSLQEPLNLQALLSRLDMHLLKEVHSIPRYSNISGFAEVYNSADLKLYDCTVRFFSASRGGAFMVSTAVYVIILGEPTSLFIS